jgi:hypothetical protein
VEVALRRADPKAVAQLGGHRHRVVELDAGERGDRLDVRHFDPSRGARPLGLKEI